MNRRLMLAIAGALALAPAANAASLDDAQVKRLQALAPGQTLAIAKLGLGAKSLDGVVLKRIEVYAPGAKVYVAEADGLREIPRNDWSHYIAERTQSGARFGLSLARDGRQAIGTLMADDGRTYSVRGIPDKSGLLLEAYDSAARAKAIRVPFTCGGSLEGAPNWRALSTEIEATRPAGKLASRMAVVAVDTDNELFAAKFAESTVTATTYFATLFVSLNLVYERDLDLTLQQGTTILRPSAQPDPYPSAIGSDVGDQLDEFGEFWVANQSGTMRAFAMQVSGKQLDDQPGFFGSEGIAWQLSNPNVNYCTQLNNTFGSPNCSDGQCTAGHYSVSRVFRSPLFTAADDTLVIAHELGHNFGLAHTHCTDATTGASDVSSNTIDQCYNIEGGCYSGPQNCPAPGTVNGVAGVRGTLMAYCHLNGISGCDSTEVFADRNRTTLMPKVAINVNNGCFTSVAAGTIFMNGFE
jgi:hypothetical protein